MKKFKRSWLRECLRFERASTLKRPRSRVGLEQFHRFESTGNVPACPDPFYDMLRCGKAWWEWTVNEIVGTYGTPEWVGWHAVEQDFRKDAAGLRQIKQRLRVAL